MVSIRTAASFVPNNISLPSQLYTQASNFADELKKWQGIYDNYAQQEYRQQMIERLKADSELKKQQEARSELYKQQLMDAVNNYNGDVNSPEFANRMIGLFASNGKLSDLNKFIGMQQKAKGKGGTPKLSVSERNAERRRGYLSQARERGGDTLTNAIDIAFNDGDIKSAKELVELRNKLNKSNDGDNEVDNWMSENGNAPQQGNEASSTPKKEFKRYPNVKLLTSKEAGREPGIYNDNENKITYIVR